VRFSWQRKDALVTPDKPDLMRRIAEEIEHSSITTHFSLNQLLMAISATPEHRLRLRRPVRVQPVANIRTDRETKTVTAPMPILILQDSDLLIKPLADFDASVRRKARSDRSVSVVLGTFAGVTVEALSAEPKRPEYASLQPSGF
jgi:DNA replication terminus site-binding protein